MSEQDELNNLQYFNFKLSSLKRRINVSDPFSDELKDLTKQYFKLRAERNQQARKVCEARIRAGIDMP